MDTSSKTCHFCDKAFERQKDLHAHLKEVHINMLWVCPCGKPYGREDNMKRHMKGCKLVHPDKCETIHCPYCDKTFGRKDSLNKHLKICKSAPAELKGKVIPCPICESPFNNKYSMERHLKTCGQMRNPPGSPVPGPSHRRTSSPKKRKATDEEKPKKRVCREKIEVDPATPSQEDLPSQDDLRAAIVQHWMAIRSHYTENQAIQNR